MRRIRMMFGLGLVQRMLILIVVIVATVLKVFTNLVDGCWSLGGGECDVMAQ
jgi:hypothetical protein